LLGEGLLGMPLPGPACTGLSKPVAWPFSTRHLLSDQSTSRSARPSLFQSTGIALLAFVAVIPVLVAAP
jgi:hypothetical protein